MRRYVRVIADGAETRIPARGRIIFIDSATAGVLVTARKDETGRGDGLSVGPITMQTGRKLITPQVFDDVTIRNESGASNTVTVLIGDGDFDVSVAEVTLEPATIFSSSADVTAGAAATVLLPVDTTRKRAHFKALATNTQSIRLGGPANVGVAAGAQLNPGEGITVEGTGAISCIREAAGVVDISILLETRP